MEQTVIQSLDLLFICHEERQRELLFLNKHWFTRWWTSLSWPTSRKDTRLLLWHATLWTVSFPYVHHVVACLSSLCCWHLLTSPGSLCTFSRFSKVSITPLSGVSAAVISEYLSSQSYGGDWFLMAIWHW